MNADHVLWFIKALIFSSSSPCSSSSFSCLFLVFLFLVVGGKVKRCDGRKWSGGWMWNVVDDGERCSVVEVVTLYTFSLCGGGVTQVGGEVKLPFFSVHMGCSPLFGFLPF